MPCTKYLEGSYLFHYVPLWEALRWQVKDYGDLVTEDYLWDLQYLEESVNWTLEPLAAVLTND